MYDVYLFLKLIEYNDTKDHADMTSYGPDDVAWNSYEFANFTWENVTSQSSGPNNMVLFNATRTDDEIWSQNGSLTLKVCKRHWSNPFMVWFGPNQQFSVMSGQSYYFMDILPVLWVV